MKYSPLFFARNMPKKKWDSIPFVCKIFFRPIGYVLSTFFAYLRFSANAVSILNFFVAIASCVLLCFGNFSLAIVSCCLFMLWIALDNVDGNLARCIKKQKYGEFFDAISGYIFGAFFLTVASYYVFTKGGLIFKANDGLLLLISSISSASFVLLILFKKKFSEESVVQNNAEPKKEKKPNIIIRIGLFLVNEFGYGGLMPIIFLFSIIFGFIDIVILVYSCLFFGLFLAGVLMLIAKGIIENKKTSVID